MGQYLPVLALLVLTALFGAISVVMARLANPPKPTAAKVGPYESGIADVTDKALPDEVLAAAWPNLTFTVDPIAASLQTSAAEATELGLLDKTDLAGIYDLTLLNDVLREAGRPEVPAP